MFKFKLLNDDHIRLGARLCNMDNKNSLNLLDFTQAIKNAYGKEIEYEIVSTDKLQKLIVRYGAQYISLVPSDMPCIIGFNTEIKCIDVFKEDDIVFLSEDNLHLYSSRLLNFLTKFINQFSNDNVSKLTVELYLEDASFCEVFKKAKNINYITDTTGSYDTVIAFMLYKSIPIVIFQHRSPETYIKKAHIEVYDNNKNWLEMNYTMNREDD